MHKEKIIVEMAQTEVTYFVDDEEIGKSYTVHNRLDHNTGYEDWVVYCGDKEIHNADSDSVIELVKYYKRGIK